jgi:hypothetical protein
MIGSQNKKINVMVKYLKKDIKNSKDVEIILKNHSFKTRAGLANRPRTWLIQG